MRGGKYLTIYHHRKKIWIDLENSPHVPFFKPIIEELKKHGYHVMLTARNCSQVWGLADLFNFHYKRIGRHYGKNKIFKVAGLILRALQMASIILREKPNLALSHGSRSQILLSSILHIPSVSISDYEYTKKLPLVCPTWIIVPEVIPDNFIKGKNVNILKYPGIKEDVYAHNFKSDQSIKEKLGIDEKDLVVTIRPPATEAHYHNHQSEELFEEVIDFLGQKRNIRMVLLPRNNKQAAFIRKMWPDMCTNCKIVIPDHVVEGLNLIWHSDLVISGGGTMNREAAALGVPVYSIFRGKIGAIDQYLADSGRLNLLENVKDVRTKIVLVRRDKSAKKNYTETNIKDIIVDYIIQIAENLLLDHGKRKALNHSNLP